MPMYIKKPMPIHAEPYREGLEDGFAYHNIVSFYNDNIIPNNTIYVDNNVKDCIPKCMFKIPYINTLEGRMIINPTDYIITGIRGEKYPCKKDIFEETYDLVKE